MKRNGKKREKRDGINKKGKRKKEKGNERQK